MSEVNMEMAKAMYNTVCATLDSMGLSYKEFEEDLVVSLGYKGEDLNHDMLVLVDEEREVIQVVEKLPLTMNAEKATDIACAVCYANQYLVSGKFIYDMKEEIRFKVSQIYTESLISQETIKRMIMALVVTVEEYDDKFMALNKGYITSENFAE